MDKAGGQVGDSAGKLGQGAIDAAKKKTKTHSPSMVFYDIGTGLGEGMSLGLTQSTTSAFASYDPVSAITASLGSGLGTGMQAASDDVKGIASNSGLAVGYVWAQSVVSGANSVLKTADYQAISTPQVGSALAKTALGADGLLGPAGSGAAIPINHAVTVGAGTPAVPIVNNHVYIDGTELRTMTRTEIETALNALADSIPQQVG
jgi:hypothetical protein